MCFGTGLTYFFITSTELCHVFPTFNLLLLNSVKVFAASNQIGNQKGIFIHKMLLKFFQNNFPYPPSTHTSIYGSYNTCNASLGTYSSQRYAENRKIVLVQNTSLLIGKNSSTGTDTQKEQRETKRHSPKVRWHQRNDPCENDWVTCGVSSCSSTVKSSLSLDVFPVYITLPLYFVQSNKQSK